MRIGIDARALTPPLAGIGNYFLNILKEFEKISGDDEVFLYAHADINWTPLNSHWYKRIGKAFGISTLSMMFQLPIWTRRDRIDVFWAPWPILPFFLPSKKVVVVHDLVWKLFPQTMNPWQNLLFNVMASSSIKRADAILAVSDSTRSSLKEFFPSLTDNISIAYCAAGNLFRQQDRAESQAYLSRKFGIKGKFFLNISTIEPRKNQANLLRAFNKVWSGFNGQCSLVIAGGKGWRDSEVYRVYHELGLEGKVLFPGYLSEEDLPKFYAAAECFVFPSLYEGFGIPPLEAMSCGCPVIISDRPALPEIAGGAALVVDPLDIDNIANAMGRILIDPQLWRELSLKGMERAKSYSWEHSARKCHEVLRSLAGVEKVV